MTAQAGQSMQFTSIGNMEVSGVVRPIMGKIMALDGKFYCF